MSRLPLPSRSGLNTSSAESMEDIRIGQLEKENADLRTALLEHEQVLELIMAKYRHQVGIDNSEHCLGSGKFRFK